MQILHPNRPPGKTGARDDDRRPPGAKRSTRKAGRCLGYAFDPIPQAATDLAARGDLLPIDLEVLAVLLRYRSRLCNSCWTTIGRIAKDIGPEGKPKSESTVRRSLRRLKAAGLVDRREVEDLDPDEPRNRTGYRYYFLWVGPAPSPSSVTAPPSHPCQPPPVTGDTQSKSERIPLPPEERENQSDDDGTAPVESSSCPSIVDPEKTSDIPAPPMAEPVGSPPLPEPDQSPAEQTAIGRLGPEWAPAVEALRRHWREPATVAAGLKGKHPALTPEMMLAAIAALGLAIRRDRKIDNPTGYLIKTVGQMVAEGWQPPVDPARAKAEAEAARRAEAERAAAQAKAAAEAATRNAETIIGRMDDVAKDAEAEHFLRCFRAGGGDLKWDGACYRKMDPPARYWSPELDAMLTLLRPQVLAILDRERTEAESRREQAQRDAEQTRRRDEARKLIDHIGGRYFKIVDADGRLDLADDFPTGDVPRDVQRRIDLVNLTRKSMRPQLLERLVEAEAEVRGILAARSEVAS